jgi:hypothetical protein
MTDKTRYLLAALDLLQGIAVGGLPWLIPGQHGWFDAVALTLGVMMLASAPLLIGNWRWARPLLLATCVAYWAVGTVLVVLIAGSASYMYGIYGLLGHLLGTIGVLIAALVAVGFWLLPAHQLHYLIKQGRAA